MIDTNALGPSARGSGRRSNFSISGKEMSTCGLPVARRASIRSGRRCRVWGPNTRSTYGARSTIAWPSCDATQPPTPISTSGLACLNSFQRPSCENTFSCAFSRIEQVFTRITSACDTSCVRTMPRSAASTSSILRESYSFIWQPWVWMKSFFEPDLGAGVSAIGKAERAEIRIVAVSHAAFDAVERSASRNGRRICRRDVRRRALWRSKTWHRAPVGAHSAPMNAMLRPGARSGRRAGAPSKKPFRLARAAAACALLMAAAWAGPAAASVLYRCVGSHGEIAYVSHTVGYRECTKLGAWPAPRAHAIKASLQTTRPGNQPSGTVLPGKPPHEVKANPSVLKVTPLGEDNAIQVQKLVRKQAWQPLPVAILDALGGRVLPQWLGVEPPAVPATEPVPANSVPEPGPASTAPVPLKLDAEAPKPPKRGAVYRVVQKNGSVLYTNVASLAKGHDAKMLFTYIVECYACNVHSKIDWNTVPLHLAVFGEIGRASCRERV